MALTEVARAQLCDRTLDCFRAVDGRLRNFPGLLKGIIEERAWERRKVETGGMVELGSLYELITENFPRGWHEDPAQIEALLSKADPEVLVLFREAMHGTLSEQRRPTAEEKANKGSATTFIGRGTAYRQARIARDCPDQLELVKDGTKTIAQVAREQGWVKPSHRVTLVGNGLLDADRLVEKFGPEYQRQLSERLKYLEIAEKE